MKTTKKEKASLVKFALEQIEDLYADLNTEVVSNLVDQIEMDDDDDFDDALEFASDVFEEAWKKFKARN